MRLKRQQTLNVGTSTPSNDDIPTKSLKPVWPIGAQEHSQLVSCILTGHNPSCFRKAIVSTVQKSHKIDLSSPRSDRPIAFLSALGKGLERLLAKCIAWIRVRNKVIAVLHLGPFHVDQ